MSENKNSFSMDVTGKTISIISARHPSIVDLNVSVGTFMDSRISALGEIPVIILDCKTKAQLGEILCLMSNLVVYDNNKFETNIGVSIQYTSEKERNFILQLKASQNNVIDYRVKIIGEFFKQSKFKNSEYGLQAFLKEYEKKKSYVIILGINGNLLPQVLMIPKKDIDIQNMGG